MCFRSLREARPDNQPELLRRCFCGLFYPHEGLMGWNPEVCSVVVWASSKLRSLLSSQEFPLPLRAARLLQSGCSQVSHQPPHGCCQAALVGKCSDASHCVCDGDYGGHFPVWVSAAAGLPLWLTHGAAFQCFCDHASIFNVFCSKYTSAISAAPLFHYFLLAQTMRKKCQM